MEKFIYYNNLYLIYKDLLNENYQDIFNLYYGDNLTMQEIADIKGVSKSRVGVIIQKVQKKLDDYENKLHILDNNKRLNNLLDYNNIDELKKELNNIIKGE